MPWTDLTSEIHELFASLQVHDTGESLVEKRRTHALNYYRANAKEENRKREERRKRNLEGDRKTKKLWRAKNKEKLREKSRRYWQANKEKINARRRAKGNNNGIH